MKMRRVTNLMLVGLGFVLLGVTLMLSNILLSAIEPGFMREAHKLAILTSLVGFCLSLWGMFVISCNVLPWFFGDDIGKCDRPK